MTPDPAPRAPGRAPTPERSPKPNAATNPGGAADEFPLIAVAEPLPPVCRAWLAQRARVLGPHTNHVPLDEWLSDAEGLIVRTATQVDAKLLDRMPQLRVVGRAGVGLDHIDLERCAARGIAVVHTPGANTGAVVEYVLALAMDAVRPRLFLERPINAERWAELRDDLTAPRELSGMTVGVYGCGRIGSRVARAFAPLAKRVLVHDVRTLSDAERHGAVQVDRETLLKESDLITVHVDGRTENRELIDADAFGRMRSDVVFINTSRGLVVDHAACAAFFASHDGAQALIDVHEPEPIAPTNPLWDLPNAHLAPHLASCTAAARERMGWVVRDVWRVLMGEEPEFRAV